MKSLPSHLFRDGEILSPTSLRRCYDGIARDLGELLRMRYTWSTFKVPFHDIDDADGAAEKEVIIKTPATWGAIDITRVDLHLAGTADTVFTLTITGATGAETVSVTGTGATTLAKHFETFQANVPAATEVTFTLNTNGGDVAAGYAMVTIRHDRWQVSAPNTFTPPLHSSGDVTVAATVSAAFDQLDADAAVPAAQGKGLRIQIVMAPRNTASATAAALRTHNVPGIGRTIDTIDWYTVAAAGVAPTYLLKNQAGATIHTGVAVGIDSATTAKDQANSVATAQTDDPDDINDDWTLDIWQSSAGTLLKGYAVLYYS